MYSVICSDIPCSRGSSAGCFSSYETMALSSLPPTRLVSAHLYFEWSKVVEGGVL